LKEIPEMEIENLSVDKDKVKSDSVYIARNQEWFKNTKKDVQLFESLNVMYDMIRQNAAVTNK
jgi:cell division GTPase FtsZ